MRLYKLDNKLALRFKNTASEFLKAYTSNTLDAPRNAFVNLRGQVVCTFDQMFISPEKVLIVIEKQYFERLKNHLEKYLKLVDTVLEEAAEFQCYYDLEGDFEPERGEIYIPQRKGVLIGTQRALASVVSDDEFRLFRLKHGVPLQGVDYDEELLLNVGDEEFVSYTKGCYLGQEIIARVHHRSKPPRRLVVKSGDSCTADELGRMTSARKDPESGQTLGFVFVNNVFY